MSGYRSSTRKYYRKSVFLIFRFSSDQETFTQSFHHKRSILITRLGIFLNNVNNSTSPVMRKGEFEKSIMCRRRNTQVIGSVLAFTVSVDITTRMHSSGMLTACLLTISQHVLGGGVCLGGVCLWFWGVCVWQTSPVDRQTPVKT